MSARPDVVMLRFKAYPTDDGGEHGPYTLIRTAKGVRWRCDGDGCPINILKIITRSPRDTAHTLAWAMTGHREYRTNPARTLPDHEAIRREYEERILLWIRRTQEEIDHA